MKEKESWSAQVEGPSCYLLAKQAKREFRLQKRQSEKRNLKEEEINDNIGYWKKQGPDVDSDAHVYPGVI